MQKAGWFGAHWRCLLLLAAAGSLAAGAGGAKAADLGCALDIAGAAQNKGCPPAVILGGTLDEVLKRAGKEEGGAIYQNLATLGQTANTVALIAGGLAQDIISAALESDMAPDHTGLAPFSASSPGAAGSLFMISGYKALSHDGYSISSSFSPADGKTPAFDENSYGLTIAGRMDGSELLGAAPHSVTLGVLANYTHTDIEVDAPGGGKGGSANIDSWSVGGYGLVTNGEKYGLVTVVGTFGSPTTKSDFVIPAKAEFSNFGVATSAVAGVLLPVGGSTKLDLRGGLNYIYAESEDYRDSFGTQYSDGHTEEFSGSVSARLFSIMHFDGYNIRPFVQSGLTYRFLYENELKINSETFSFDDADTSVFARAGFDFDIGRSTQAYLAVRGDASEDMRAIAAQVGVTFKLD